MSTLDQHPENQLDELRRYAEHRGWSAEPFVDHGISGTKESRPELNRLLARARRRQIDVVVRWRLDRPGRNLKHLITVLDEFQSLGVAFVSLGEGIDATTPAGKLQLHILGAIAEFERGRIVERVKAGLARARANGRKLGRPRGAVPFHRLVPVAHLSNAEAARSLGVSLATLKRWRKAQKTPSETPSPSPEITKDSATPDLAA